MRHVPNVLLGLVAVAVMSACGGARSRPGVAEAERATIAVDNRAFTDMTVYVSEAVGSRRRLGLATGVSTTVFTIPSTVVGNGRRGDYLDGHSLAGGVGILFDQEGIDHYVSGVFGQGVGYWEGVGILWDAAGDDVYQFKVDIRTVS